MKRIVYALAAVVLMATTTQAWSNPNTFDCDLPDASDEQAEATRLPPVYFCGEPGRARGYVDATEGDIGDWFVTYRDAGEPVHLEIQFEWGSADVYLIDPQGTSVTPSVDGSATYTSPVAGDWYIHVDGTWGDYHFRIWRYYHEESGENLLPASVALFSKVVTVSGLVGPAASGLDASWIKLPETAKGWEIGGVRTSGWIQYYDANHTRIGEPLANAGGSGVAPPGAEWIVVSKPNPVRVPTLPPPMPDLDSLKWTVEYYY